MSNGTELQLYNATAHESVLTKQLERLDKFCATQEVRGENLIRYAMTEIQVNDDLRQCTPTSVYLALLACACTGLVPGKLRGFSFLVPFRNKRRDGDREYTVQEATFMMGWRGVKHIGFRAGLDLVSAVVHQNDDFDFDKGSSPFVRYKQALKGGGPVIGAAAWCKLPRGGLEVEYMGREELDKVKAAAERLRPSPAWNGAFRDQMERKTALKRLGKQIEMGEEFFRADAIELAQDEHGSAAHALDQFTDGSATKFLASQSAESATFGHMPRPAQVQVPAAAPTPTSAGGSQAPSSEAKTSSGSPARSGVGTSRSRAQAGEATRPTQSASSSSNSQAGSSSASPSVPASNSNASGSSGQAPTPTSSSSTSSGPPPSPTPTQTSTPTLGTSSSQGSASPSQTSATNAAPSPQTAGNPSESSASGDLGDVAGEPGPDDLFDASFGVEEDPVDSQPQPRTPDEWLAAFQVWRNANPTKEAAKTNREWQGLFDGWLKSCQRKSQMDDGKAIWKRWSESVFFMGRRADRNKGIEAAPADEDAIWLQKQFADRTTQVQP